MKSKTVLYSTCLVAILMFATSVTALYLHLRRRLYTTRWFHRISAAMTPAGFLAIIGGWYLAETGRQPYVVFGLLPTADAVSPVAAQAVLATFTVFVCVYAVFLTAFLVFTVRHIRRGPTDLPAASPYSGSLKRVFMTAPPKPLGAGEG